LKLNFLATFSLIALAFPIASLFFLDAKEFIFSIVPGFWPTKALSSLIRGEGVLLLTYFQYYFIGLVYVIVLNYIAYRFFLKRSKV